MIYKSPKIQLGLTIQFAFFFIVLSGFIYFIFTRGYEENVRDKFRFKTEILVRYIQQNPQVFYNGQMEDKTELIQLLHLNDVLYFVLLDENGYQLEAINFSEAKSFSYLIDEESENISPDGTIYRLALPIQNIDKTNLGKLFVGYKASHVISDLNRKNLKTLFYCLLILFAGIIVTYYLSSISYKPIVKLSAALSKTDRDEQKHLLSKFKGDEAGELAEKILGVLAQLDHSSNQVENLNEKLKWLVHERVSELDAEVRNRKTVETYMKKTEVMFKLLFENAPIGMIIITRDGKVLKANKAFCDTVDYDDIEIIGAHIKNFFDDNGPNNVKSTYQMIMESDSLDLECSLSKRDNRKISVLLKTTTLNDDKGKPINTLLQVLDITQIKKAQEELELALDQAQESDRLKSAFLAQMSHEIRTPLNVILPSIPLLADEVGSKDKELISILHAVDNASKRLQRTIDMILSMSAVQSGNYKAQFEIFNLAEDLKNLTNEFKPIVKEKGLQLFFHNKCSNPEISADRYTIGQVFQNLINNAIKYTQVGHVNVSIEDYQEDKIVVKIKDTGIGISEKYLKNLFTPFSQEDSGQTRKYEGNGLGLALVKEYVTLNKGQILVQSEKNKGSVFSVIFDGKILNSSFEESILVSKGT